MLGEEALSILPRVVEGGRDAVVVVDMHGPMLVPAPS